MSGRTGDLKVKAGNLVAVTDPTPLVVINQIKPIYAAFQVPAQYLSQIAGLDLKSLAVQARPPESPVPSEGRLAFMDNQVDPGSNTIVLKAAFPNDEQGLWPGQFVDVVLTLGQETDRIVVPSEAVVTGQNGQFVYVVKPDQTAEVRPVQVDRTVGAESVVASGLSPGETVVTDGQVRLMPGSRIEVKSSLSEGTDKPS